MSAIGSDRRRSRVPRGSGRIERSPAGMFTRTSIRYRATEVPGCVRTLAGAEPGRSMQVTGFLHPAVRTACAELGLDVGAILTCRDRGTEGVVAELDGGLSVLVPWPHAHLVRVEGLRREPRRRRVVMPVRRSLPPP